nr:serine hydrolase [Nakamurella flavida]
MAACTGGSTAAVSSAGGRSATSVSGASGAPASSGPASSPSSSSSPSASPTTSPTTSPPAAPPAGGGNPGAVPGVPTDEQRVADAIAGVDALAQDVFDRSGLPGMAVAVVHGGETVFAQGYGVRRVGSPETVDADTVFQMASLSKPVGATVVAKEVGDGTVTWDTPVADHLPGFTLSDPTVTAQVTIADMYSHRSGLPNHAGDDLEDLGYDQQQILDRLRYLPLNPFRAVYNYTNYGLTAAGVAVADAAGTDWSTLSQRDVYGPLGMDDTSSDYATFAAAPNHAAGHVKVDGQYAAAWLRDPDGQSPAGGLSSTVNDFATWMTMVLAGGKTADGTQLIDGAALRAALTPTMRAADGSPVPQTIDARTGFYGHGFGVSSDASGRVRLSHSGAFGAGAGTSFLLIPNLDLGIVVLTNAAAEGSAEAIVNEFADAAELGAPQQDWYTLFHDALAGVTAPQGELVGQTPPADPAPAAANSTYVGTYQSDYFGPATVSEVDGGLVLTAGPRGDTFPLTHWDGSTFTLEPVGDRKADTPAGENVADGSISQVTFTPAGDTAGSVTVEAWDKEGLGTFTR